jgi:hypothetical protein
MRTASTLILTAALFLSGCFSGPDFIPIYNTRMIDVRLMQDMQTNTRHNHPYTITTDAMVKVLSGVQVEERDTITGIGIFGSKEGKAAFTRTEIANVSPHLVEALRKASPKDLATFYMYVSDGHDRRAVTSGGIFVDGNHIHVILANWRSVPSGGQDYTVAMEVDTRDDPLLPISPFRFRVGFYPTEAWVRNRSERYDPGFPAYHSSYEDPAKYIVVDLENLLSHASLDLVTP